MQKAWWMIPNSNSVSFISWKSQATIQGTKCYECVLRVSHKFHGIDVKPGRFLTYTQEDRKGADLTKLPPPFPRSSQSKQSLVVVNLKHSTEPRHMADTLHVWAEETTYCYKPSPKGTWIHDMYWLLARQLFIQVGCNSGYSYKEDQEDNLSLEVWGWHNARCK